VGRNNKILVLSCYFSLGAFALISQAMILREFFVVVNGNEFIFGVLLTNWLIGIFAGALSGGIISERSRNPSVLFVIAILVMAVLLPVVITMIRLLYTISGTLPGTYIGFSNVFLYSGLFIIPISFFIGFVFPIAAKMQTQNNENSSKKPLGFVKGIANIYIFEGFGSLFSGVLYTFLLAGRFNVYFIAALFTLPLAFWATLILWRTKSKKMMVLSTVISVLILVSLLPPVNAYFETATVARRWQSVSPLSLIYSRDSRYQNIAIAGQSGQHSLYLNTMFAAVFPNDQDNMILAAHLMCQHPGARRILIIGDAVSGLAKFLLRYNVHEVVSVEIDEMAVETIGKFLPKQEKEVLADSRFSVVIQDGRKYVKDLIRANVGINGAFDLVYVNAAEPATLLLNRYYTREFFQDLSQVLGNGGVIALQVTASENYEKGLITDYTASIYNTVKAVFPRIVVAPGTENMIIASEVGSSISDVPEVLESRYQNRGVEPSRLGLIFYSLYPAEKTHFIKKALQNNWRVKINTDETPIASLYYNKVIGWYGKSNVADLLGFFQRVKIRDILLLVLVLFLTRVLYVSISLHRDPDRIGSVLRFNALLAVFAGGMAGLSLELVILYTYQDNFGNVYYIIGFIIALFMFGLPLGAVVANRIISHQQAVDDKWAIKWMSFSQVLLASLAFLLPSVMKWFSVSVFFNQLIIFLATIFSGFLIGLIFPLSVHIYIGNRRAVGHTAGIIDAFDHLGAAVGAFFMGTVLLPVFGVQSVCHLVAFFPLMAACSMMVWQHPTGKKIRIYRAK
jgi:spermidine synthase